MKIGIVGNGFVGKATKLLSRDIMIYDIDPQKCHPIGIHLNDLEICDLIFIAVPTPMDNKGKCHLNIVKEVVYKLKKIIDPNKTFLILRSTVPPGTSDLLGCYFMPEFLTEKNWEEDFINCKQWIFGTIVDDNNDRFKQSISNLLNLAYENGWIKYKNISFVKNKEAEMIKYFRNTFLAVKVSYCNEMYQLCNNLGIDYDTVRTISTADERIGESHTKVPGHDGKLGFGGTCLPKDCNALLHIMEDNGVDSYILKSAVDRNEKADRLEKDWENNIGRSVI